MILLLVTVLLLMFVFHLTLTLTAGVYHITRDGCRLWCSRCHPSLPSELPADNDPDALAALSAPEGEADSAAAGSITNGSEGGVAGSEGQCAGDLGGEGGIAVNERGGAITGIGVASVGLEGTPVRSSTPTGDGTALGGGGERSTDPVSDGSFTGIQQQGMFSTGAGSWPTVSCTTSEGSNGCSGVGVGAGDVSSVASAPTGAEGGQVGGGTVDGTADFTRVGEGVGSTSVWNISQSSGPVRADAGGALSSSGTMGVSAGSNGATEGRAPLKRDLLRRKFDEEISEPWVQCDRCNSWVHQVTRYISLTVAKA